MSLPTLFHMLTLHKDNPDTTPAANPPAAAAPSSDSGSDDTDCQGPSALGADCSAMGVCCGEWPCDASSNTCVVFP